MIHVFFCPRAAHSHSIEAFKTKFSHACAHVSPFHRLLFDVCCRLPLSNTAKYAFSMTVIPCEQQPWYHTAKILVMPPSFV